MKMKLTTLLNKEFLKMKSIYFLLFFSIMIMNLGYGEADVLPNLGNYKKELAKRSKSLSEEEKEDTKETKVSK